MLAIEKYMWLLDDSHDSVNWYQAHSTQLVFNQHVSATSIKCFSITIEDRNQNINMAVMFFRHNLVIFLKKYWISIENLDSTKGSKTLEKTEKKKGRKKEKSNFKLTI